MRIDDFDWETLFEIADDFMKSIRAKEYTVAINDGTESILYVHFPKRVNGIAIMMLNKNNACFRCKGYKNDGKLYCVYGIRANQLN